MCVLFEWKRKCNNSICILHFQLLCASCDHIIKMKMEKLFWRFVFKVLPGRTVDNIQMLIQIWNFKCNINNATCFSIYASDIYVTIKIKIWGVGLYKNLATRCQILRMWHHWKRVCFVIPFNFLIILSYTKQALWRCYFGLWKIVTDFSQFSEFLQIKQSIHGENNH